jgi:hypothetical protein
MMMIEEEGKWELEVDVGNDGSVEVKASAIFKDAVEAERVKQQLREMGFQEERT